MDLIEKIDANGFRHPWEIARARSILKIVKKNARDTRYADIGAGDLFLAKQLCGYTDRTIYAVDINYKAHERTGAIEKVTHVTSIPRESIDCLILMDVLEHVEDESKFMGSCLAIVKNEGQVIVTVPAHQILFSSHDIFLKHYRRYSNRRLRDLFEKHDFEIKKKFYFYTVPFIIRCLQVVLLKLNFPRPADRGIGNWRFSEHNIITVCVVKALEIDFIVNKLLGKVGGPLPGLSLCYVCQKKHR